MLFLVCGFVLLSCRRDIESHFVSPGLGSKRGAMGSKISEADLILNRAGKFDVPGDEKRGMAVCPRRGGGDSHMKQTGMLVVSLRGVNFGFWSRLGCSRQGANILSRQGLA